MTDRAKLGHGRVWVVAQSWAAARNEASGAGWDDERTPPLRKNSLGLRGALQDARWGWGWAQRGARMRQRRQHRPSINDRARVMQVMRVIAAAAQAPNDAWMCIHFCFWGAAEGQQQHKKQRHGSRSLLEPWGRQRNPTGLQGKGHHHGWVFGHGERSGQKKLSLSRDAVSGPQHNAPCSRSFLRHPPARQTSGTRHPPFRA